MYHFQEKQFPELQLMLGMELGAVGWVTLHSAGDNQHLVDRGTRRDNTFFLSRTEMTSHATTKGMVWYPQLLLLLSTVVIRKQHTRINTWINTKTGLIVRLSFKWHTCIEIETSCYIQIMNFRKYFHCQPSTLKIHCKCLSIQFLKPLLPVLSNQRNTLTL